MGWITREYQSGDEQGILRLYRIVWERPYGPGYLDWLRSNPEGYSMTRVAECANEIVGYAENIPIAMNAGRDLGGFLGFDAATDPNYRGKGIMKRLVAELHREASARGLLVGFGVTSTHTPMIRPISSAGVYLTRTARPMRDFFKVLNLPKMILRRHTGFLPKAGALLLRMTHRTKKFKDPDDVSIELVSDFDESFDKLWQNALLLLNRALIVKRSSAYLRWRYGLHPENKYLVWVAKKNDMLLGYIVARHDRREEAHRGIIADILSGTLRTDVLRALISTTVDYFKKEDAEVMRCQLSEGHPCGRILEDLAFASKSSEFVLDFHSSPAGPLNPDWLIRNENHIVTWGDHHAV